MQNFKEYFVLFLVQNMLKLAVVLYAIDYDNIAESLELFSVALI